MNSFYIRIARRWYVINKLCPNDCGSKLRKQKNDFTHKLLCETCNELFEVNKNDIT